MNRYFFSGGSSLLALNWLIHVNNKESSFFGINNREINYDIGTRVKVDFSNPGEIRDFIFKKKIDVFINTIALTNVDKCETSKDLARFLNYNIAKNIAIACNETNCKLVHISTDQIFNGNSSFYKEDSLPDPINIYGITKLMGEQAVLKFNPSSLVIRTNFFGCGTSYRSSFSDFIYDNLYRGKKINLYDDIFYTPIDIKSLIVIINNLINQKKDGVYNISGSDRVSKYDFGINLAKIFSLKENLIVRKSFFDFNHTAKRPMDMSLDNQKISNELNTVLPNLNKCLKSLYFQYHHCDFCQKLKKI